MPSRLLPILLSAAGVGLLGLLPLHAARAQQFSYGADDRPRPTQSVSFGYMLVDFTYHGEGDPSVSFAYTDPAYGVVYTRPNFQASLVTGEQAAAPGAGDTRPRRLLDASLTTWGEFLLHRERTGAARIFLPIALHSNYRRVAPEGEEDSLTEAFNVTVLGLGAGVGFDSAFGDRVTLEARALPIIGLAVRAFGDAAGSARLLDTDVQLHLGPLVGRFGLSVGYGFRTQVWSGTSSNLLQELEDDLFDYRGTHHLVRVGVNW